MVQSIVKELNKENVNVNVVCRACHGDSLAPLGSVNPHRVPHIYIPNNSVKKYKLQDEQNLEKSGMKLYMIHK